MTWVFANAKQSQLVLNLQILSRRTEGNAVTTWLCKCRLPESNKTYTDTCRDFKALPHLLFCSADRKKAFKTQQRNVVLISDQQLKRL